MRKVRNVKPTAACSLVVTIIALLFLSASPVLSAPRPRIVVQKAAEPVRNEYLIMLNVPADDVPKVAKELTKRYGGEVLAVWQHAVKGFWLKAEPEVARHMVQDKRIRSCEENAVAHDSAEFQLTNLNEDQTTRVKPAPGGEYAFLGSPDHPLWHLNRISHRQRQDGVSTPDFKYTYGSDGSGIAIYIIDGGVFRWHQEFYPKASIQVAITHDADIMAKEPSSPRVRIVDDGANVTGKNPSNLIDDSPVKSDTGNNGDPIAPRDCTAVAPSDNQPHPYNFADASATHGTACASAAAGRNVGVAKGATIVPVKALTCNTLSLGAVISGLNWTLESIKSHDAGRAVVSMSLVLSALPDQALVKNGTTNTTAPTTVGQRRDILNTAITALTDYGVPVVVSANNQNKSACETSPANLSIRAGGHVISVGGLSKSLDKRWVATGSTADEKANPGSNYGQCVDIWAPAQGIEVATLGPETASDHGIAYRPTLVSATGTSFSAPIVAGIIARLMSENSSLGGTDANAVKRIYDLLISSATRVPDGSVTAAFGEGSPNRIAYIGGLQITTQPASFQFTGTPDETHDLSVTVLTQFDTNPTYQWYSGDAGDTSHPVTLQGTNATLHLTLATDLNSSHWVKVTGRCYDGIGECSAESIAATAFPSSATECPIEVQVDASVLTRVIASTTPPDSESGMPIQQFDRTGVDIVAYAYGAEALDYEVSIGGTKIAGDHAKSESAESVDPNHRTIWVASVHVAPSTDTVYTVKFMKGTVCVGSTNVSVSVCNQPVINRKSPRFVWTDGLGGQPPPPSQMLDPVATSPTAPSDATFQWFTGSYAHPVAVPPRFGLNASQATQLLNPLFYPLTDEPYWARIDTRCGWAVSGYINVVSCYKYNFDFIKITTPRDFGFGGGPGPVLAVAKDSPVLLASKLVTALNVADSTFYEWTNDTGQVVSTEANYLVTPNEVKTYTYTLRVFNGNPPDCQASKPVTLTVLDCHLIAGPLAQSGPNGTELAVALNPAATNVTYEWFAEPSSWTWDIGLATFRPEPLVIPKQGLPAITAPLGHKYFVRVTGTCGNGVRMSEDSNTVTVSSPLRRHASFTPLSAGKGPTTQYVFGADEGPVTLSAPAWLPNASYTWHSQRDGQPVETPGTGLELVVHRIDVAPPATPTPTSPQAATYWVTAVNATDSQDSATIRLVVLPTVASTVADPAILALPGTVMGTQSILQLIAVQAKDSIPYPVGTTFEWRQAVANLDSVTREEDGTFSKNQNSALLNSHPGDASLQPGPITGHAAYWVRVITPSGSAESDVVLIIVKCEEQPPSLTIYLSPASPYVQRGVPIIFNAQGIGRNLIYQWYHGVLGDLLHSDPVGSGGGAMWTTSPDGPYWVHATDDCGRTAEAATTVYLCTPTIPDNVSPPDVWIKSGDWAHLSVNATPAKSGGHLYYQWYPGNTNLQALPDQTPTLDINYTGTFLAVVSGDCGDNGKSGVVSAPMTVRVCTAPPINGLTPASHDTRLGTTEVLYVTATGDALTYQWYQGVAPDITNPVADGTTAAISVHPTVDSDYWVRVTDHGACWTDSNVIHLTVCAPPAIVTQIVTQPPGGSVFSGSTATLTVAATALTAAPLHYTWFEVAANGSQEAVSINGSPSFTTPALTTDRTWFVRVYSGSQLMTYTDSLPATIHVCDLPAVTWASAPTPLRVGDPYTLLIVAAPAGSQMYWYRGVSGDVEHSTLIGVDAANYRQVTPAAPSTSYWVRVQKDICYSDSPTFTLNVCVPTITQQPAGGPIIAGGSVTLSVAATTSPLTYEWFKGASGDRSQPIAGATGATYTASPTEDTLYWVRVYGSCGLAESDATLVSVCYPPAITGSSPTQWAIIGSGSTTVSVSATGANLTYQWYTGNSGNTATPISGATGSSLTLTPQNTTSYWVRVSGSCGPSRDSVTMLVNVCGSPAITAQPQGSIIFSGGTATMSVSVNEATTTPVTYQWYRGATGDASTPVGTNSTTFTTPALTAQTSYWVRVSCGICTPADSQAATVSICNYPQTLSAPADQFIAIGQTATLTAVTGGGDVYQWYIGASGITSQPAPGVSNLSSYTASPSVTTQYWAQVQSGGCTSRTQSATVYVCVPTITQQPAGIMINSGASTTLSVAANTSGLTYQWYVGNTGTTTTPISGATTSSVTVSPTVATSYWVRVTGSCSRSVDSAVATVTICAPPAINGAASTQSVVRNSSTSCFVTATGTNLSYQWYVGASGDTSTPISGATSSSVTVTPQNTTSYWARVTGTCGTVNSVTMLVNVCATPAITAQPQGSIIFSGGTASMSVTATEGTTTGMTYQWYRGATGDVSAPVGTNSTSFTTPALTTQTSYWVRVSCGICNPADSQAATISICYYPQTLASPGDFYNTAGQSVRLNTVNVNGNTYQWYTGASGDQSHPYSSNLSYADVAPTVTTQYWAQVQNGGCISRTATANVYVCIPTFTQQPASATIVPGSSTTLTAAANTAGVTYQWYTGASGNTGAPIAGATGPSVTVTPGSDSSYWVRAIGTCGRTTDSATATVVLCSPPVITLQARGTAVYGGGSTASMLVNATGSNLTYQWYAGNSGDMTNPISGATTSSSSFLIYATQKVWVRITGTCGAVNSNDTFVSVYPTIWQQPPSSQVVGYDTTASISLSASAGNYMSYVWRNVSTNVVIATTTTPTLITPQITANMGIYCQVYSGNAATNSWESDLTVCYNQPNVSIVKAPNGACSIAYVNYGSGAADDYQWYQGARGDTSHLVSSGSTALYVCPTVATQYWLRAVVWSSPQVVSCYTDTNSVTLP